MDAYYWPTKYSGQTGALGVKRPVTVQLQSTKPAVDVVKDGSPAHHPIHIDPPLIREILSVFILFTSTHYNSLPL